MIAEAKLAVQINRSNPPRPTGVGVMVGGKIVAVVKIVELRRVLNQIDHLEVAAELQER